MLGSLTAEIKRSGSPVRSYFDSCLGNVAAILEEYRRGAGDLVVSSGGAPSGTAGTAADWLLRFLVCPQPDVHLAMAGAARLGPKMMCAVADLAALLGATVVPHAGPIASAPGDDLTEVEARGLIATLGSHVSRPSVFDGPTGGSEIDRSLLARGCWVLALLTEVFRMGDGALRNGPLARFAQGDAGSVVSRMPDVTADDLLELAPTVALGELEQIREVFETSLIPTLQSRVGEWELGPVFAGSALLHADTDLVAAGLLVELKTTLGRKRSDGSRTCVLDKTELYQLVGYALLDFDDRYQLAELAVFNARYGYFVSWQLGDLLNELSGGVLDALGGRMELQALLRQQVTPTSPFIVPPTPGGP